MDLVKPTITTNTDNAMVIIVMETSIIGCVIFSRDD